MRRSVILAWSLPALALVAFGVADDRGTVGGVPVGAAGARLSVDLSGRVARTGPYGADATRRVVLSPDGRWRAVERLPGWRGNTGRVALGRNAPGARLRTVERHLFVGTAPRVLWSPDSRWLAMTTWVPTVVSAVAVRTDGRRRVLASPVCGDFEAGTAWEPRGHRIALAVPPPGRGCRERVDLRLQRVDGGARRVVARDIAGVPIWSADGRWLATTGRDVEVMRADGTQRRRPGGTIAEWSPRGSTLAVVGLQGETLDVMSAPGRLTGHDDRVDAGLTPRFSPDGGLVAYRRWDAIVVRQVADWEVRVRVPTTIDVLVRGLSWAPDGRSLVVDARVRSD